MAVSNVSFSRFHSAARGGEQGLPGRVEVSSHGPWIFVTSCLCVSSLLVQLHSLDINALDADGWTALHAALFFEQDKAAELLMMAGASIHLTTKMVLLTPSMTSSLV